MGIIEEKIGEVIVEIVNMDRATMNEAQELKEKLNSRMNEGYRKFIVDLSSCDFVDSTFLGVLVGALKKTTKMKGDLKIVGFRPAVKSMFELTRLFRIFETFTDLQDAIRSFNR
jgi:anti-anti-sigma factor